MGMVKYIKHYYNEIDSDLSCEIIDNFGLYGYGFYWVVNEEIVKNMGKLRILQYNKLLCKYKISDKFTSLLIKYGYQIIDAFLLSDKININIQYSLDKIDDSNNRKKYYRTQLQKKEWKTLRKTVILRDNQRCANCGSKTNLQVHHLVYKKGLKAWEYDICDLVTLCKECHYNIHKNNNNGK